MPIRYVGLFCPVNHFNVVETYPVAHVYDRLLVDWVVSGEARCRCGQCGKVFSFRQRDIVHSNRPDGRDGRYANTQTPRIGTAATLNRETK